MQLMKLFLLQFAVATLAVCPALGMLRANSDTTRPTQHPPNNNQQLQRSKSAPDLRRLPGQHNPAAALPAVALPACQPADIDLRTPNRKLLLLVRHGSSVWNEAGFMGQAKSQITREKDHPLTLAGLKDALSLNAALRECPIAGVPGHFNCPAAPFNIGAPGHEVDLNSVINNNNVPVKAPNILSTKHVCLSNTDVTFTNGRETIKEIMTDRRVTKYVSNLRRAMDTVFIGLAQDGNMAPSSPVHMTSDIQEHGGGIDARSYNTAEGTKGPYTGQANGYPKARGRQMDAITEMCPAPGMAGNFRAWLADQYDRNLVATAHTADKPTNNDGRCPYVATRGATEETQDPFSHTIKNLGPDDKVVVVAGHSLYFREFINQHAAVGIPGCDLFKGVGPNGVKMANGAVVGVVVNTSPGLAPANFITECVQVYGGTQPKEAAMRC